jgi:hypothetical protein
MREARTGAYPSTTLTQRGIPKPADVGAEDRADGRQGRRCPAHIATRTVRGDPEFRGRTARGSGVTGAAAVFPSYQAALTVPGAGEPYGETIRGGRRCSVTSVRRPSVTAAVM